MANTTLTGYGKKLSGFQTQASKLAEDYSPLSIPNTELTETDKRLAELLGTSAEEAAVGIEEAQTKSEKAKTDMASLAGETEAATQRSERQVMVENVIAGLGKVVAGILGEKEGYAAAPMDIKTSNLSELLAGRLKGIEEKRRTASAELETSERQLENRLQRAARRDELKTMSREERAQFMLRAMLEKDMMDQKMSFEREQLAAKDKEKKDTEKAGSLAIIKQTYSNKLQEVKDVPKQIDSLLGDLSNKDEAKVIASKRQLASMLGEDPTAFESLDNQAIEARALERRQEVQAEAQGINNALLKLGQRQESKKGLTDEESKAATTVISGGLLPDVNSKLPLGSIDVRKPETLKTRELVMTAGADPSLGKAMAAYIEKVSGTPWYKADAPAIDIVQEKIRDGRLAELTKEDLATLDSYKDPNTGKGLTQSFLDTTFTTPKGEKRSVKELYAALINKAKQDGDYEKLKKLAPGSKISLKGFGE